MKSRLSQPSKTTPILDEIPAVIEQSPASAEELLERFFDRMEILESAPKSTLSNLLQADGVELPTPDTFTEDSVHDKLWEVIHALARHRHFLDFTDHLSDLEMYRQLWDEVLKLSVPELSPDMGDFACQIDLVGGAAGESIQLMLRYYATEEDREQWARDNPGQPLPDLADPPYDRDRLLPKRLGTTGRMN